MRVINRRIAGILILFASVAMVAGCGSSSESSPAKLSLKISEAGKKSSFQVPKTSEGGLVEVELKNLGTAPHGVEFIQYTGSHSEEDVLKELGGNSEKIPLLDKAPGRYRIGGRWPDRRRGREASRRPLCTGRRRRLLGPQGGPPATAPLELEGEAAGGLPSTPATVTAANPAKDKYKWETSGLKTGKNKITFNSKGKEAVHLIIAVPIKGKAPPLSQIEKDLASNGPPPSYVDANESQSTAIVDGGGSQTTTIELKKAGAVHLLLPAERPRRR